MVAKIDIQNQTKMQTHQLFSKKLTNFAQMLQLVLLNPSNLSLLWCFPFLNLSACLTVDFIIFDSSSTLKQSMMRLSNRIFCSFSNANQIIVQYKDLVAGKNIKPIIQQAYGPQGLGILFVEGIPDYPQVRKATLPLFHKLANLPADTLKKYERPEIFYSKGWSCGVEQFQGNYDTSKGSYYVNCSTDKAFQTTPETEKFFTPQEKQLFSSNRWIDDIPEIEKNVKVLSKIMTDTGALLALQIDAYAQERVSTYPTKLLHRIIKEGQSHTGRILHYFPFQNKGDAEDDWCGWHNDHGSLTALTSALYTDEHGEEIKFALKTGGLYAKNRFADVAKISIPANMLAFQLGESTQIHTGGSLEATPHCVIRSEELAGKKVGRNTFALFLEPDPLEVMGVPKGVNPEQVSEKAAYKIPPIKARWENDIFFKDFHSRTIKHYS